MSTVYIDRRDIELQTEGKALVIRENGERVGSIPLIGIDRVVILGNAKLDTRMISVLAETDTGLVILQRRGRDRVAMLSGCPRKDCRRRQQQALAAQHSDKARPVAWTLVNLKLARQLRLLHELRAARPDRRRPLHQAMERLRAIRDRLKDDTQDIDSLRGHEGAAAAHYFPAYASVFPASLKFRNRNRRPPRDPVNACLSLGYTLIFSEAVQQIHQAGLDPYIGFLHYALHGRESLAADLMEPLRIELDRVVWQLFRERHLRPEHFSNDRGACRMGKEARRRFYQTYEQQLGKQVRRLLRASAYRLISYLETA